jgi:hypothetical protein
MHNRTTATCERAERELCALAPRRPVEPEPQFAPLYTGPAQLAITTIADELGRPLVGVSVPDGELL